MPKKEVHHIETIHLRPLKSLNKKLHHLVKGKLWLKVLMGMFIGIITGILLGPNLNLVDRNIALTIGEWLALPGIIFLRIIQMIVIPLIFASIIRGMAASENIKQLKKTGAILVLYFIFTTMVAIIIGISLASIVQPGKYVNSDMLKEIELDGDVKDFSKPTLREIPSLISGILPTNLLGSVIEGEMLQVVIFSIIFGIALISIKPKQSKPLLGLLGGIQDVSMTIVKWAMLLAPIAVFGLMARLTSQFGLETLVGISVYVATVLLGLLFLLIFYLTIVFLSTKKSPFKFLKDIRNAQLLAFSTSSSAAVMPLSMKTAEEKLKIRPSISRLVIPIGATVNMDGTALYQGIATIFLAQVFGLSLGVTALLLLLVTIVGASIGSPGTPGVGIAILSVILNSMGIPIGALALILGVDRILDMSRTAINVTGDLTAGSFLDSLIKKEKIHKKMLKEEKNLEKIRRRTGEDIIIKERSK